MNVFFVLRFTRVSHFPIHTYTLINNEFSRSAWQYNTHKHCRVRGRGECQESICFTQEEGGSLQAAYLHPALRAWWKESNHQRDPKSVSHPTQNISRVIGEITTWRTDRRTNKKDQSCDRIFSLAVKSMFICTCVWSGAIPVAPRDD